jgi:parallel beta-helix repeat protein
VGNLLRGNTFENIRLHVPDGLVVPAVYIDDMMGLHTVVNNSFTNCSAGVFIGGGRNNVVQGNHFVNIDAEAVHVDARGVYYFVWCQPGGYFSEELLAVNYKHPPYSIHFPSLVHICKCPLL